jgi:hypothetical protein
MQQRETDHIRKSSFRGEVDQQAISFQYKADEEGNRRILKAEADDA